MVLTSFNLTSFAQTVTEGGIEERAIESESSIELLRQAMHENIMTQLESQGAADPFELFREIFDEYFNRKYYAAETRQARASYYAPNVGWIRAYDSQLDVISEFMTAEDGDKYFKTLQQYGPENALAELVVIGLGTVWKGLFGSVFTFAAIADKIAKGQMWNNINLGVDPVLVVSSYDKIEDRVTAVVGKWNGYPTMSSSTEVLGNVSYQIN